MHKYLKHFLQLVLVIAFTSQISGCSKDDDDAPPPVLNGIHINTVETSLPVGLSLQLGATATYSDGSSANISTQALWESSDTLIATVNSSGLMTSNSIGPVDVNISYGGFSDIKAFTITNAVLTSIETTPVSATMAQYDELQLTAIGIYSDSSEVDLSSSVTWSTSESATATVDNTGLVTAQAVGQVSIAAELSSVSTTTEIDVDTAVTLYRVSNTSELRATIAFMKDDEHNLVILSPGVYKTTDSGSGRFDVDKGLSFTIQGDGPGVVLEGSSSSGVFSCSIILPIKFVNVTLQNGVAEAHTLSGGGSTTYHGGGIRGCYPTITLIDSIVQNNYAKDYGGGIWTDGSLVLTNSIVRNNTAGTYGGGIYVTRNIDINSSSIESNNPSGVQNQYNNGTYQILIENSRITDNNGSSTGYGVYSKTPIMIKNTVFRHNATGVYCESTANVVNSLFIDNDVGMYVDDTVKIINTSFFNNGQSAIDAGSGAAQIDYSFVDVSNISAPYLSSNIVYDANPKFIDYATGNYHLQAESAMVNAGTENFDGLTAPTTDFDGVSRPQGVAVDIGPYEYIE